MENDLLYFRMVNTKGLKLLSEINQHEKSIFDKVNFIVDIENQNLKNGNDQPIVSGIRTYFSAANESILVFDQPIYYGNLDLLGVDYQVQSLFDGEIIIFGKSEIEKIEKHSGPRKLLEDAFMVLTDPMILLSGGFRKWYINKGNATNSNLLLDEDFTLRVDRFYSYIEKSAFQDSYGYYDDSAIPLGQQITHLFLDRENNLYGVGNLKGVFYGVSTKRYKYTNSPIMVHRDDLGINEIGEFIDHKYIKYMLTVDRKLFAFGKSTFYYLSGSRTLYGSEYGQLMATDVYQIFTMNDYASYMIDTSNNLRKIAKDSYNYHNGSGWDMPRLVMKNIVRGISGKYSNLFFDGDGNLYESSMIEKKVYGAIRYEYGKNMPNLVWKLVKDACILGEHNYVLEYSGKIYKYRFGESQNNEVVIDNIDRMFKSTNHILAIKNDGSLWLIA